MSNNRPLTIAIDGNEANTLTRVGSNVYAFEIISQLEEFTRNIPELTWVILLSAPPIADLPAPRVGWSYRVIAPKTLWTQWALPLHLFWQKDTYDLLYTPGHYAPRFSSVPYVCSVMDLAFLEYPKLFKRTDVMQLRTWTEYSVLHAQAVITISEYSKKEIQKWYRLPPEKILVVPPAISKNNRPLLTARIKRVLRQHQIKQPFFLFMGTLQPRKNLIRLIDAFELLHRDLYSQSSAKGRRLKAPVHPPRLVLAGKTGWLAEPLLKRISQSPLKSLITITGFVSEQEKLALYQASSATVLVGLSEGFGIPALEAMQQGSIPVVAGNTSLPEVVGKAGIFVDPFDASSIAAGLKKAILYPEATRKRWSLIAQKQLRRFS